MHLRPVAPKSDGFGYEQGADADFAALFVEAIFSRC
jgi:hypothetical protein